MSVKKLFENTFYCIEQSRNDKISEILKHKVNNKER